MTFEFLGQRAVSATSDVHLVATLRQATADLLPSPSVEDFMDDLARFANANTGRPVRTRSIREFLFDVQLYGLLRPLHNPWQEYALEAIQLSLLGPMAPTGWQHQLIWSSELPFVVSTNMAGISLYRSLPLDELRAPERQAVWVREHLNTLSLYR